MIAAVGRIPASAGWAEKLRPEVVDILRIGGRSSVE